MIQAVDNILRFIDQGDLENAFNLADMLDWDDRGMYQEINDQYISPPHGISEELIRRRLKRLILSRFKNALNANIENSSFEVPRILLNADFLPQKEQLNSKEGKSKHNFVLLQGTPDCGLHYFVLWRHESNSSFTPIKADVISGIDNEIGFWDEFAKLLDLGINVHTTKKDIPSTVALKMEERLKEKPIVLVVYNIECWQGNCGSHLSRMSEYLAKLPLEEEVTHGFSCYFIHTGGTHFADCDEHLIVLPPVSELEEEEIKNLYYNHKEHFKHCEEEAKVLFSGKKKLSEVIEIFTNHSSCGQAIDAYMKRLSL